MPVCYIFNSRGERLLKFNADAKEFGSHITIGRSLDNRISVARFGDMYVSRFHCELYRSGKNWFIRDCQSRWGIRYNEKKVQSRQLNAGDVIRFSHLFLGFGEKSGPSAVDVIWEDQEDGNVHRAALWRGKNTLGASVDNSVRISGGDGVFRYHAVIEIVNDRRIMVRKDHDTALVAVNGKPIGAAAEVRRGDRITLGNTVLRLVQCKRVNSDDTIEIDRSATKKNGSKHSKGTGIGPEYEDYELKTKVIYGVLAAVILLGLFGLGCIVLLLF